MLPLVGYELIMLFAIIVGAVSAIVGETVLELLSGEEDAALDGAEGKTHFVSYFVVFVALNVHCEWHAVFFGEFGDGFCDFACGVGAFGRFESLVLR